MVDGKQRRDCLCSRAWISVTTVRRGLLPFGWCIIVAGAPGREGERKTETEGEGEHAGWTWCHTEMDYMNVFLNTTFLPPCPPRLFLVLLLLVVMALVAAVLLPPLLHSRVVRERVPR